MRAWRSTLAVCLLCATSCAGQRAATDAATAPLDHGQLVLWIVHSIPLTPGQLYSGVVHLPNTIQEQTAGRFGKTAGSVGQTAGTYGEPASSLGTPAGSVGQTAGTYGQTAGGFGQNSSAVGQTAGRYGQTAGSFGETAGRYGETVDTMNDPNARAQQAAAEAYHHPPHDRLWTDWLQTLRESFPELSLEVVDVRADELQADLLAAHDTSHFPDILLGRPLPASWTSGGNGLERQYGIPALVEPVRLSQRDAPPEERTSTPPWQPEASILRAAPHPREARAFMVWFEGGWNCFHCPAPLVTTTGSPEEIAKQALASLLEGGGISAYADPAIAPFDLAAARAEALGSAPVGEPVTTHLDVMDSASNGHLAVVALRAVVSAPQAFGVVNSLAVLRKDPQDHWRILQITPALSHAQDASAFGEISPYASSVYSAHVSGISQASPSNGDNRSPQPELWWDNRGGAALQVVEWQRLSDGRLSPSHLFFVPDTGPRPRTRVTARFASTSGAYRWRVWSVGSGGGLVLSPWRTFNIVP